MAWASICNKISLTLAALLIILVPFDADRNIDMQGLILIIAGAFAWLSLVLTHRQTRRQLPLTAACLVTIFGLSCVLGVWHSHLGYDLLGSPYIRLGALGLLSCVGCGLLVQRLQTRQLIAYIYSGISFVAIVSIPYTLLKFHSLYRVGGVLAQADIFACLLGCGILFGWWLLQAYPQRQKVLVASQLLLIGLLIITQTRAGLLLTILLSSYWMLSQKKRVSWRIAVLAIIGTFVLVIGVHYLAPNRLTDASYASQSVTYRWHLQTAALHEAVQHPLLGYGPGNLADALSCQNLTSADLQHSCRQGYFFNSSHNIYLDRILALGWLGGLAYIGLVAYCLYHGLRARSEQRIMALSGLLIALYYFTNVTSVVLELLFWVLLLHSLPRRPASHA